MLKPKLSHVAIAVTINAILVAGAFTGVHYFASGTSTGLVSVGFEGAPVSGVSHIYLTVTEVDFQGGENTTDAVYLTSPTTFDLLSLVNVTRMLGQVSIAPGHYNMVRFVVTSAVATISGKNVTLKLPSGEEKVPVQFYVVSGLTTSVVLSISPDGTQIVHNHILRPVATGAVEGPY